MTGRKAERSAKPVSEIEITPEMIEAGMAELMQFSREADIWEDRLCAIYSAMVRAMASGLVSAD